MEHDHEDTGTGATDRSEGDATSTQPESTDPQDTKARFRAALDRKRQQARQGTEGRQNTGAVHGPEVLGGGPRRFRRKSG